MSRKNKKTVVFAAIFVLTAFLFSQSNSSVVTWKDYVDSRIEAVWRAVDKADIAMSERLKILNEFKDTYLTAQKEFATEKTTARMEADIRELRSIADEAKGKASQTSLLITSLIAVLALAMNVSRYFSDRKKTGGK